MVESRLVDLVSTSSRASRLTLKTQIDFKGIFHNINTLPCLRFRIWSKKNTFRPATFPFHENFDLLDFSIFSRVCFKIQFLCQKASWHNIFHWKTITSYHTILFLSQFKTLLRIHWRLLPILKTSKKVYEVMFFDI